MKIKKGDKLMFPPVEVIGISSHVWDDPGGVVQLRLGDNIGITVSKNQLKNARKVLGLLGDEGLEAQVDMKVWDAMLGDGVIESIQGRTRPVYVRFDSGASMWFNVMGNAGVDANRTCYVTAMPEEEPKGFAWVKHENSFPHTHCRVTKKEAEEIFGNWLLHWIPESEVKNEKE